MARAPASLVGASVLLTAALLLTASVPRTAVNAVLSAERARTITPALERALASKSETLAVRAALAVGRTKRVAGETLLLAHLDDGRAAVRAMSVYAIGLIASGRQNLAIERALRDGNGAVRVAALDAADRYAASGKLSATQMRALCGAVVQRLQSDASAIVRTRAAATLESFNAAPNAAAALQALTLAVRRDRAAQVRRFAMWSIFRGYATVAAHAFLQQSLNDPDEVVRIEAVRAIGRRKNPGDAALVKPLLRDSSWRAQEQAAETLRLLHGEALTQHWTAIPAYVHVPQRRSDLLRFLPAMPRASPPSVRVPPLDPTTAAAMSGPARGPHPRVRIVTTQGNLYVTLFPEWAPTTVENFLTLANRGYYDHNRWFRIVPDFVVQTGDPNDNGNGDAGYTIPAEENPVMQDSYVISMGLNYTSGPAPHAIRDSAGTQYYITLSPQLHLDRDFTVFGEVTSGFWVLGRLTESDRVVRIERIADQTL